MHNFPVSKEGATLPESQRRKSAQAFIASADWKVLSVRAGKYDPTDEEPAPVTAVWFAKGLHKNLIRDVLEILGEQTEVRNPVVDKVVMPGTWYHRFAEYRRDGGAGERGDVSYTVYRTMGGGADGFTKITQNGCTTTTSIQFKWDQPEVENAPDKEQGFDRQIGGVNQDPVTKLFNYYISTVEEHTFHNTSVLTAEDRFSRTYTESWTGLRGTKANPTDDEGNAVSVPSPTGQTAGTTVRAEWSHNDRFCTWAVRVTRAVAKEDVVAAEACSVDQFQHSDSVTTAGQADKLGHAPEPDDGLVTKHSSRLREDGLYDNTVEQDQELAVTEAESASSVDLYKQESSTTARQVATDAPSASAENGVITQVSVSKTRGKRRNINVRVVTENNVPDASVSKSSSIFEDTVEAQEKSAATDPADPVSGDGQTQQVSYSKTPGKLRDISIQTRTEKEVEDASVSSEVDLFYEKHSTLKPNSSGSLPAASSASGTGVSVTAEKTPGGRRNVRVVTEVEKYVPNASVSRQATIFEVDSSVTHRHSSAGAPSASAGNGIIISAQEAKTPHGRRNVTISTKEEKPVTDASVSESGDIFHDSVEQSDANVTDPGPPVTNPSQNVLNTRDRAKTPGGMRRVSNRRVTFKPVTDASVQLSGSWRETSEARSSVNQLTLPSVTTGFTAPGAPIISLQYKKTPANAYDYTKATDTPGPFRYYVVNSLIPGTGLYEYVVTFVNASNTDMATMLALYPGYHIIPSYGWNKFALMEGTIKFTPWLGYGSNPNDFLDETDKEESEVETVTLDGITYKRVTTYTYDLKRDEGVSTGLSAYSGALNRSFFNMLGNDWYFYKKVTDIVITHEEVEDIAEITHSVSDE